MIARMEAKLQTEIEPLEKIKALAQARERLVLITNDLSAAQDQVLAKFFEDNKTLIGDKAMYQERVRLLEEDVRRTALAAWEESGNKQPYPGCQIAEIAEFPYPPEKGLEWAIQHGQCLTLDRNAFKDVCKSDALRPEFVGKVVVPTCKLASDLAKALKEATQ